MKIRNLGDGGEGGMPPSYNARMKKDWTTKLIHSDARVPEGFRSLATPVYRGSTTLFSDAADVTTTGTNTKSATPTAFTARPRRLSWRARSASSKAASAR